MGVCVRPGTGSADLLDESHGERVPGDDAVVHELHEGREREGQQVAETTRQHRRDGKRPSGRGCGTQRGERGAAQEEKETGEHEMNAAPGLLGEHGRESWQTNRWRHQMDDSSSSSSS